MTAITFGPKLKGVLSLYQAAMPRIKERLPVKNLYYRRRYEGLRALDRVNLHYIRQAVVEVVTALKKEKVAPTEVSEVKCRRLRHVMTLLIEAYLKISLVEERSLPKIARQHRTIDSFWAWQLPLYFRFPTKEQLKRHFQGLELPDFVRLESRLTFAGEEVLLMSLTWRAALAIRRYSSLRYQAHMFSQNFRACE